MKRTQLGYYNLDFTPLIVGGVVVGIVIGVILAFGLPWLWEILKPFIHALTAP
jgi:hypothetical protein